MKEKYTFYYKRLRRYQDSDENTEKEPSSKSKVKVGLLPLSPLRWGKTGNKNGQLVWRHCCETSCAAMMRMFPPTNQTYLQQIRLLSGADLGGGRRGCAPPSPWDDLRFSNITGILQGKKTMWFIGVEVEQETSAPPPKKNPGSAPGCPFYRSFRVTEC